MGNNKNKWFLNIFLSILCLIFLLFLLNAAPLICAELPPLDSGNLPFSPLPGAFVPPGGGFLPQSGAPYGLPYQNIGPGFMPLPTGQYGGPYQAPGPSFMPPASQYGSPYQAPGPAFMPPTGQYGSPYQAPVFSGTPTNYMAPYGPIAQAPFTQAPLFNTPTNVQTFNPFGPMNPYVPPSTDTSGNLPVYNTGYNPVMFPNRDFYGPVPNMYALPNAIQQSPGLTAFNPASIAQGNINPFLNPSAVPYGNIASLPGAFPQQRYAGYQGLPSIGYNPYMGYNPIQRLNPWLQPWSPYGRNINPYTPNNPYQPYIPSYNPGTYYPGTGGNGDDGDDGGDTDDIPNIKGHWAGTWEVWLTDPNEGVITDPNDGQPIITMSGAIRFEITQQPSKGGAVLGKIEIKNWDVYPPPSDWLGDWTGESDEVILTGWIDIATRYLKARYYYYPGQETSGNYDENEDYTNIKGLYTWFFNTNKLKITDSGISGQCSVTGTDGYYEIGVFNTGKYVPQ